MQGVKNALILNFKSSKILRNIITVLALNVNLNNLTNFLNTFLYSKYFVFVSKISTRCKSIATYVTYVYLI